MKVVCHKLEQATNDPDGNGMEDLVKVSDKLVLSLADKVVKTFGFSSMGASSWSCKYVLNTLMQTFQNRQLAHAVKDGTLDRLITELLLRLLDERVPRTDDGSQLLEALNVLMLKILVIFTILVALTKIGFMMADLIVDIRLCWFLDFFQSIFSGLLD